MGNKLLLNLVIWKIFFIEHFNKHALLPVYITPEFPLFSDGMNKNICCYIVLNLVGTMMEKAVLGFLALWAILLTVEVSTLYVSSLVLSEMNHWDWVTYCNS